MLKSFLCKITIKRFLKIATLAIAVLLCLLLVCLAFLPSLLSSKAIQKKAQHTLSSVLKRSVTWSSLTMTWSDGLTLSGLKLGHGPAPLLRSEIDRIVIIPGVGRGSDGKFGVDLAVRIQNVQVELAPGPPKPPPPKPKDPLTLLAESIQKVQQLDLPLPLDVRVIIEAAPVQLAYTAPAPGKQLRLQDFSFHFSSPSLVSKPVTARVNGRLAVDGRQLGKVSFNALVSDLVTKEQRISLASALFAVDAAAPGTSILLTGGLSHAGGFAAKWRLDLPELLKVAQPFIPPDTPQLEGNIEIKLRAKTDANRDIHAMLTVDGAGVAARGGLLKSGRIVPLDLMLQQQIATDHRRQRVDFPGGRFVIAKLLDAAWRASVIDPTAPGRSLEVSLGPMRLDLVRALSVAAPFLPPDAPVKALAGELFLRSASLHLKGPRNNGDLSLAGLGVKLSHVRLKLKKGELVAEDTELAIEKADSSISANLPTRLAADLRWSIRKAEFSGEQPLFFHGMRGKTGVAVTDLNLKSASPRKVAASAAITQSLDLDRVSFGKQLAITNMHEQLRLVARAAENGEIAAALPEFAVTAILQGALPGRRFGPVPLSATLAATDLRLAAAKDAKPTLKHASAKISAGDFLQLAAEAALSGATPQRATTGGTAKLDLQRAMPFVSPFVPSGLKAAGAVSAEWALAAPLPQKTPANEKHPLRLARAGLSLFDKLEFNVKLDDISATVPSAKGAVTVTGLRTEPDLRVVSTKKGESFRLEGGVLFSGMSGLPGAAGKFPVQHGSFALNGYLSGWKELRLTEEFRIEPLGVSQEGELNVSRIDALLEEKQPFSPATLIKRLDATLFTTVDGAFPRELKQLLPGFAVAGNVGGSVRVDLSAGRELALRCSLKTNEFGIELANGTKVEGMRSDILFNRVYALAATKGETWTPLSKALVRPGPVITANPGAAEIAGRIHGDLRGNVRGGRSFSIRSLTTKASGVPLVLTALEGDLLFSQEKAGLTFLQADLLGGTLLASGVFDLRPEIPNIAIAGSFSNLDVSLLLPKETRRVQVKQDAGITGEINLTAPLTPEQRELFEQLRLALNVRRIGGNTIDRVLFSLDPYERNEQIVAQRKMLRLGVLKGLRATAVDGAFSMEGEAQIKGVAVDLPKVERLRISELPLRQELVRNRKGIMAVRNYLDLVRADTLVIGPKGKLSLQRRTHDQ